MNIDKNWEKSIFPKVLKLAEQLAAEAQSHSQWHKRMNAHNLNQSGAKVEDKGLNIGDQVYFYKWLPWDGTAYPVPQYRGSTRFFFFIPSDEKTVIG